MVRLAPAWPPGRGGGGAALDVLRFDVRFDAPLYVRNGTAEGLELTGHLPTSTDLRVTCLPPPAYH